MNRFARIMILCLSAVVFSYAAAGYLLAKTADDKTYSVLTVYSEVLEHIQHDYVEDPNIQKVTAGAMHGLLDSLDSESSYMSPLEYADYKKSMELDQKATAGMVLSRRFAYISVISILPDSPALKAGLRVGDVLETIAGFTTSQMAVQQADLLLRGAPGTVVKLTVIRPEKTAPEDIELTLEKPLPAKLLTTSLADGTGYVRVPEFASGMTAQIREQLLQFEKQGVQKLVLDLRDCAAGSEDEGIAAANLFLSSGTITSMKGQTVATKVFTADPAKAVWKGRVVVLTSTSTAGPAEIVAAAIIGNHRGESAGLRTFGNASEQKTIELEDGAALILTIADYLTPDGKVILSDGVEPTSVVAPPLVDSVAAENGEDILKPGELPPARDSVVKKALDLLERPLPMPVEQKKAA
jgi:carboxyl-terminal processing protease